MPRFASVFKALCAALLLASLVAPSAGAAREETAPVITGVSVRVDGEPSKPEIAALIPISAGELYSPKKISSTIKQVFKTGLFSDIQVLKEGQAEVRLTFLLTQKLMARSISFQGNHLPSQKKLRDSLYSLRPEGFYSEERIARAKEELAEALDKEGYLHSQIQARTERDPNRPLVDVIFSVTLSQRYTIRSIEFPSPLAIAPAELKKSMTSREGQPYIPRELDADLIRIKDDFVSAGYPRAEVTLAGTDFHEENHSVTLVIQVVQNEKILILIRGAKVPEAQVRPIWEEKIFEDWGLLQSEAKVLSYLRSQGYIFATAKSSIEKRGDEIRVVHEVNPGKKYKIFGTEFEGLRFFTPAEIKAELGLGPEIPLLGGVGGARVFELPRQIEDLYRTRGFNDTRVDLNFRLVGGYMTAIFNIEEGPQEKIRRVAIGGASLFGLPELRSQISSKDGGPYFQPNVQRDLERLENFYLNQGVRNTKVSGRVVKAGEREFDVDFLIQEGQRIRVEKVIVAGNVVTRMTTILRELRIREGDWAYSDRILETRQNLEKLGIFSEVKVDEVTVSPDSENLVISVREGDRNYIGLGAGLETKNPPQNVEFWKSGISPRGTIEFIRGNIFGTASQLSFVTQFSLIEKHGAISWEQPYFFGLPVQTALNGWLESEERVSFGYDQRGISYTGIKPLGKNWVSLTTLRWARTTLTFLEVAESEVDRQFFPFSTTAISESLIRDRRDDTFNPERGSFLSVVGEWAYPLFGVESNYLKSFVKYQRFFPILTRWNFSVTARLGLGSGRMPIHERFFGGGSNSFRGETFDELSPKDATSGKPIGGKALFIVNFELRFPLFSTVPNLAGVAFYDKGNVFYRRKDFRFGDLEDALGLGIRYRTPLGPLRLDFGWNLNPPSGRAQPMVFITIGNIF